MTPLESESMGTADSSPAKTSHRDARPLATELFIIATGELLQKIDSFINNK